MFRQEVVMDNGFCRPFRLLSDSDVDKQKDGNKLSQHHIMRFEQKSTPRPRVMGVSAI